MEEGFQEGQSNNLPRVDGLMVAQYFSKNADFVAAEMRGVKMKKSARDSYGDDANGYVQVKRQGDICIVKCRITPEHRVRTKPYHCSLECNEKEDEILCVTCDDCAASKGGCKHTIALLMWFHRRTEEPSPTEIKCYWKKSKLSGVGTTEKFIKVKSFGTPLQNVGDDSDGFLEKVVPKLCQLNLQCSLAQYVTEKPEVQKISLHYLICTFKRNAADLAVENFITFCQNEMTYSRCLLIKNASKDQAESNLWFEMRYGRITASKMHEASQCKTNDGSLVETIFGASKFKETAANLSLLTFDFEVSCMEMTAVKYGLFER